MQCNYIKQGGAPDLLRLKKVNFMEIKGIFLQDITLADIRLIVAEECKKAFAQKPMPKKLTRDEVCRAGHITLPTLHNWVKKGLLHPSKVGGRVLFSEDEVTAVLSKKGGRGC